MITSYKKDLPDADLIQNIEIYSINDFGIFGKNMTDDYFCISNYTPCLDLLFDKYAHIPSLKKDIIIGAIDNNLSTWALSKLEDDEALYNELFAQIFAAGL